LHDSQVAVASHPKRRLGRLPMTSLLVQAVDATPSVLTGFFAGRVFERMGAVLGVLAGRKRM
jgi:hypothetical protein